MNWKENLNIQNFEKLLLGFLLLICVGIGCYKYMKTGDISNNWLNTITVLGGLFLGRKAFSYFKKDTYNRSNEKVGDI